MFKYRTLRKAFLGKTITSEKYEHLETRISHYEFPVKCFLCVPVAGTGIYHALMFPECMGKGNVSSSLPQSQAVTQNNYSF